MKLNTVDEMIEVLQAYRDGKTIIEWSGDRDCTSFKLGDVSDPPCNFIQYRYTIKEELKKTYWNKPEDVPVGAVIKIGHAIKSITNSMIDRFYMCENYVEYKDIKDYYLWRFPHELKDSDWKECTVESLEKYR